MTSLTSHESPEIPWRQDDSTQKWLKPEYSMEQQLRIPSGKYGNVVGQKVIDAAKNGTLVPFVGAGTSCIPPTELPSWINVNLAILKGIWNRALESVPKQNSSLQPTTSTKQQDELEAFINRFGESVSETLQDRELPPEFFSEIIVNRLGDFYFNVLSVLDSDKVNTVHETLAKLAKQGMVRVIITTNFDTCIENALTKQGVRAIVFRGLATFDVEQLQEGLYNTAYSATEPVCYVLKVHGSADDASSVVDTLAQRSIGLPKEITDCVDLALNYGHWLFLGFSGADLLGEPNYLQIRPSKKTAKGYTWLNRYCETPLSSVTKLCKDYPNDKASIIYGELPDCLIPLKEMLNTIEQEKEKEQKNEKEIEQGKEIEQEKEQKTETIEKTATIEIEKETMNAKQPLKGRTSLGKSIQKINLEDRVKEWAQKLMPEEALVVLIDLACNAATEKQIGKVIHTLPTKRSLRQITQQTSIPDCSERALSIAWNRSVTSIAGACGITVTNDIDDINMLERIQQAHLPKDMGSLHVRHVNACCWIGKFHNIFY